MDYAMIYALDPMTIDSRESIVIVQFNLYSIM